MSTDTATNTEITEEPSFAIKAEHLQDTISYISVLVDEGKIHFTDSGWEVRAVDPANVGMTDLFLDADVFNEYDLEDDLIGININRFADIIGMANNDDVVYMTLDQETRKLHIAIPPLEWTIALLDPETIRDEPDLPDLELPAEFEIPGKEFSRGIKAAEMVSDHVKLESDSSDTPLSMVAEGDTDDVDLELDENNLEDFTPADCSSLFALSYLNDIATVVPKDKTLTLELGDDFPLIATVQYAEYTSSATYMVAPRITS